MFRFSPRAGQPSPQKVILDHSLMVARADCNWGRGQGQKGVLFFEHVEGWLWAHYKNYVLNLVNNDMSHCSSSIGQSVVVL